MATIGKGTNKNATWFLDSRCFNHKCGDKGVFIKIMFDAKHFRKCDNNLSDCCRHMKRHISLYATSSLIE